MEPDPQGGPWQAVELILEEGWHCRLSEALEGSLFLVREAPELPLSGCSNAADCHCRYHKHADRRISSRRESDEGIYQFWDDEERRQSGGRRATDAASPYPW